MLGGLLCAANSYAQHSRFISAVDEYVPAPGQFVNTMPEATADDTPESMAQKCTACLANDKRQIVTLGAYGGYITFHFDHPVANIEGKCDLLILGNATATSAECGIVMVSQDTNGNGKPDDEWYELSGSADIDSIGKVVYDYEITYTPSAMQAIPWTDNKGRAGTIDRVSFHAQEYFPLWIKDNLTFSGTLLPDNSRDISGNGSYWVLESMRYGYVDNLPNSDTEGNSFNIDWAVDKDRRPVKLTHIDFVRVYTAINKQCGWIGETSTEIAGAEDLHLEESLTSIDSPVASQGNGTRNNKYYSISGQEVNADYKGIVIKNGKKVFVK